MKPNRRFLLCGVTVFLTSCASDLDSLQQWAETERRNARPTVKPLSAPKKFTPQPYSELSAVEPFSFQKLNVANQTDVVQANSPIAQEKNRRAEPLEAYPLDSMHMVGSMYRDGVRQAILKVDSLLYYVKPGNYVGQNFGRILKVDEAEITIREIVQDPAGDWVERISTLTLQEAAR